MSSLHRESTNSLITAILQTESAAVPELALCLSAVCALSSVTPARSLSGAGYSESQPLEPHWIAAVPPAVRRTSSHNT